MIVCFHARCIKRQISAGSRSAADLQSVKDKESVLNQKCVFRLFLSSWRPKFNISDTTLCWWHFCSLDRLTCSGEPTLGWWEVLRNETDLVMLTMQVIRYISWHLPPTCAFNKSFHNVYVNMQMWFMSPSVTRVRSVQKPREQIMNHKVTAEVSGDYLRNIQTYLRLLN